jgi:hypothetical protein
MITDERLKILCDLTFKLTEIRQKECHHLCLENFAPELLARLIGASEGEE